jgi:glycosyltransferase involved in cell wall biosynthesis
MQEEAFVRVGAAASRAGVVANDQLLPLSSAAPSIDRFHAVKGRSALVHYWLVGRRGGEIVLEAIAELLPKADLIGHVVDPGVLFGSLRGREIRETFISRLPFARKNYQAYLVLMPMALEALDMGKYDLVVSSEAGPAKWVLANPDARHICYCHSPLRYIWDQRSIYFRQLPGFARPLAEVAAGHLRRSDILSSIRVDDFVANSSFVARRIWKYYRREAEIIHPPISVHDYSVDEPADFYLVAGENRQYKRFDIAIEACSRLGRRLYVVGAGTDTPELKAKAGPKVTFLGRLETPQFRRMLSQCRALLFPGVEDFGIIPLEAMASGRPVIAYGKGGALDSVQPGVSGLLYDGGEADDLMRAMIEFEAEEQNFKAGDCVAVASRFDRTVFQAKFSELLMRG